MSTTQLRIAAVVPAFNEARHIETTLASLPGVFDRVFVVDDASEDDTAERVARSGDARVALLRHQRNRGVGAALKTGYAAARAAGADVAVVMAGDGQMDPADLPAVLAPLLRDEADYVKGNRLAHPELAARMPWPRRLGNRALSWLTRLTLGVSCSDSQCGYTAIGLHMFERIPLHALWDGYGYPNDLLSWVARADGRVVEVVVRPVYGSEVSGIGLRHALCVIPFVLLRAFLRRRRRRLVGGGRAMVNPPPALSAEPE